MSHRNIATVMMLSLAAACAEDGMTMDGAMPDATNGASSDVTHGTTSDTMNDTTPDTTALGDSGETTTGAPTDVPPTGQVALSPWLAAESYSEWVSESAVHAATGVSPHGKVRVFFNDVLVASFEAGNTEHTVGSAAVKELYDTEGTQRTGWAVMVKTVAGLDRDSWYWYGEDDGAVAADGNGLVQCNGCHGTAVDRVWTAYPLQ